MGFCSLQVHLLCENQKRLRRALEVSIECHRRHWTELRRAVSSTAALVQRQMSSAGDLAHRAFLQAAQELSSIKNSMTAWHVEGEQFQTAIQIMQKDVDHFKKLHLNSLPVPKDLSDQVLIHWQIEKSQEYSPLSCRDPNGRITRMNIGSLIHANS